MDRVAAEKLDAVATLWRIRRRSRLRPREKLDLLLAGSRFEPGLREGAWPDLVGLVECEAGVQRGWFHGYRLFLVDVEALPLSRDTAAVAMLTGERRRAGQVLDFLLEEGLEYHLRVFSFLHQEVMMERATVLGVPFEDLNFDLHKFVTLVSDKKRLRLFLDALEAKEHVPEVIEELGGLEAVLRAVGREDLARLVKRDPPA